MNQLGYLNNISKFLKKIRQMSYQTSVTQTFVQLVLLTTSFSQIAVAQVSGDISVIGDAVNIEFEGRSDWPYELKRTGDVVSLEVPKLDSKMRSRLLSWTGPLIKQITIKNGTNDRDLVEFVLSHANVQSFDYLSDQPSRLVVDFFTATEKAEPKTVKSKAVEPATKTKENEVVVAKTLPKKKSRVPASEFIKSVDEEMTLPASPVETTVQNEGDTTSLQGVFDGSDPQFSRFDIKDYEIDEKAQIASRQNIYIRFPMLTMEDTSLKNLLGLPPLYEIKSESTDENKKARLLLTLFNNKRFAVFLRTVDFYRQAYPKSKYDEIIRYMEADTYYELWKRDGQLTDFQVALTKYKALLIDYPESPLAERTQLLVGYSYLDRNDLLGALAQLESYIRNYPNSEQRHQVKLAIADSYRKLNKYDDTEKVLLEVEADSSAGEHQVAAAYKRADSYFENKDFDKALQTYQANRKKYPGKENRFPSAAYNSAEAYFWKSEYKKSLDNYREFLQKFPSSSHGGYAMTRIGELLEILGADRKKVNGAWLESMFRYRGSPGAGVANIRMVRERFKDMKPKEIQNSIKEIREFTSKSELPLIKDFETIMTADGYYDRKEYDKSLSLLVGFFQENPTSINLDIFKTRIVRTITDQVKNLVDTGDFINAFKVYGKNTSTWLKGSDRVDLKNYVARAYEIAGVPNEAAKIYREALNKVYSIQGSAEEKERKVFEALPTADELNLRLAAVSAKLNDYNQTGKYLTDIKAPDNFSEDQKIERVTLASQVAKAKGDLRAAEGFIQDLQDKWKGKPEKMAPSLLELAQIQSELKKYAQAEISLTKLLNLAEDTGLVTNDIHAKALELKGNVLFDQGKKTEAIAAYQTLLDAYESQMPLGSIRYKIGKLYFEQGQLAEAEKIWTPLNQRQENKMWSRMADEQLKHAKWQDDYKKYIDRIPAMATDKEKR